MIEETINLLIRSVINLVIAADYAIKSDQNAPRKSGSYATVKTDLPRTIGTSDIKITNEVAPGTDVVFTYDSIREVMISINTFRANAFDNASLIANCFERESVRELMRVGKTGFVNASAIRLLPKEIEGGNEERAQFDLRLYVLGSDTEVVKAINKAILNAQYQFPGYIYNETIGVQ